MHQTWCGRFGTAWQEVVESRGTRSVVHLAHSFGVRLCFPRSFLSSRDRVVGVVVRVSSAEKYQIRQILLLLKQRMSEMLGFVTEFVQCVVSSPGSVEVTRMHQAICMYEEM